MLILIVFITQRVNGHEINDVMTQQELKCTPNNQCKCIVSDEKQGMLLCEVQNFSFKCICNHFLYENMTKIHQANLMQWKQWITMQKAKYFCILELNEI